MWERLNKVSVQVMVAMIAVIGSFGLIYLLAFKEVPSGNRDLFNVLIGAVIGSTLTAVIGWLFTQSKHNTKPPTP
jgi:ABC-type enterobactin transport system permease subunit